MEVRFHLLNKQRVLPHADSAAAPKFVTLTLTSSPTTPNTVRLELSTGEVFDISARALVNGIQALF